MPKRSGRGEERQGRTFILGLNERYSYILTDLQRFEVTIDDVGQHAGPLRQRDISHGVGRIGPLHHAETCRSCPCRTPVPTRTRRSRTGKARADTSGPSCSWCSDGPLASRPPFRRRTVWFRGWCLACRRTGFSLQRTPCRLLPFHELQCCRSGASRAARRCRARSQGRSSAPAPSDGPRRAIDAPPR